MGPKSKKTSRKKEKPIEQTASASSTTVGGANWIRGRGGRGRNWARLPSPSPPSPSPPPPPPPQDLNLSSEGSVHQASVSPPLQPDNVPMVGVEEPPASSESFSLTKWFKQSNERSTGHTHDDDPEEEEEGHYYYHHDVAPEPSFHPFRDLFQQRQQSYSNRAPNFSQHAPLASGSGAQNIPQHAPLVSGSRSGSGA